jgi:hypothetical protein
VSVRVAEGVLSMLDQSGRFHLRAQRSPAKLHQVAPGCLTFDAPGLSTAARNGEPNRIPKTTVSRHHSDDIRDELNSP